MFRVVRITAVGSANTIAMNRTRQCAGAWALAVAARLAGCNVVTGLDGYHVVSQASPATMAMDGSCKSHKDCKARAASDGGAYPADFCLRATQQCVALQSQDCATISGPVDDDARS